MLAAAIGWALYSIYLFYWKTEFEIFQRFTLVAFFGAVSLFPFYIGEEIFLKELVFNKIFLWAIFAAFLQELLHLHFILSSKTTWRIS